MAPIIAAALPIVGDIVKRFVKDPDEAQRIEAEMYRAAAAGNLREMERAADVIVAEAKSGGLAPDPHAPVWGHRRKQLHRGPIHVGNVRVVGLPRHPAGYVGSAKNWRGRLYCRAQR